ncbi:MAG: serine/threonine-protein kinase, partial [Propionicimonas sp.]
MQAESPLADRYVLVRRLASGGMGEVWLARDGVLGREVAVKLISVGSDSDPQAVERFRREARMMAALEHPNIVTIFDSGTHDGSGFIVMELLAGPTLAEFVADRGPLSELEVVRLAAQIAGGLAAAHRGGVVHRDIKPSNLMFSSSGMLKILDFGIARLSQHTAPSLTAANAVIGSAPYLSPERLLELPPTSGVTFTPWVASWCVDDADRSRRPAPRSPTPAYSLAPPKGRSEWLSSARRPSGNERSWSGLTG